MYFDLLATLHEQLVTRRPCGAPRPGRPSGTRPKSSAPRALTCCVALVRTAPTARRHCWRDPSISLGSNRLAPGACRAAVSLGRLRLAQGRRDAARQLLEAALAAFTESFATAELKAAKALLSEL